jgi:hypothetical protein
MGEANERENTARHRQTTVFLLELIILDGVLKFPNNEQERYKHRELKDEIRIEQLVGWAVLLYMWENDTSVSSHVDLM